MADQKSFYITTPIYYVNDKPHVGHAYTTIACDTLARFKRLDGFCVKFLTGTDEHGQKVQKAAAKSGIDPQAYVDQVSQKFRDLTSTLQITNDDFIRTTEERHIRACQNFWTNIADSRAPNGESNIYLGKYSGWYAVRDEAYYSESELTEGPTAEKFAPTGAPVEWVEEPSYFFRLSAWQETLLQFYEDNPNFVKPNTRFNEVRRFVEGGLQDLSLSRTTFDWGVVIPENTDHVMYVWIDALTNYITALDYPHTNSSAYKDFWPADLHLVGKDIIRFHCVYWPAFLMAAGLRAPKEVFAHGWWTIEGQKMSKSLGNVIDPNELVQTYGLDQVRYFLLREVRFGADGDFSRSALVQRANGELANELGNLAQRVLAMINNNCDGQVPEPAEFTKEDSRLLTAAESALDLCRQAMERKAFHEAIEIIWKVVRAANSYVDKEAPWVLRKTNLDRMKTVLFILSESLRKVAILMLPFVPTGAGEILDQLAVPKTDRCFAKISLAAGGLKSGTTLPKPKPVFDKLRLAEEGKG